MKKTPLALRLDPALMESLDAYIAQMDVPPARTAVIEAAIRDFLAARGVGEARPRTALPATQRGKSL
jgi:predicted transcriptional regulator